MTYPELDAHLITLHGSVTMELHRDGETMEVCEDCGCAIDGQRRREYPLATVCRECARGEGEV
jgi:RNA polymerase-binding transcription factor DksA